MKAERRRRTEQRATKGQRYVVRRLSTEAGVEPPTVRWQRDARDAIRRLKVHLASLTQPALEGWREAIT
jgi:hypothetical protein